MRIKNPKYTEYWRLYDPYAPIGIHINMKEFSPSKYIEISLKDYIKLKLKCFLKEDKVR